MAKQLPPIDCTWDDAWKFVGEKSDAAKAAGNMDGYYACNRVLRAMDEARRLTPPVPECGHKPDAKYACEFPLGHEGPHGTHSGKRWDDDDQRERLDQ